MRGIQLVLSVAAMKTPLLYAVIAGSLLFFRCFEGWAYPPPPPDASEPPSPVPPAVQQLRRDMLDANVNSLTFRDMDQLFTTRTVARSGAVWPLPHADHALDFTYSFKGTPYTPAQFLERTYTNALLVMK